MSYRLRPDSGPKAATWDWQDLQRFDDSTTQTYCLTERQVAALLSVATAQMQWSTRWFNRDINDAWLAFVYNTQVSLLLPCEPPRARGGGGHSDTECIEITNDGDAINVRIGECELPVNVYINDCGCGCGDGHGGGGAGGGGAGGGVIGGGVTPLGAGSVTPCDAAFTTVPYLFNQVETFFQSWQVASTGGLISPDAISDALQAVPIFGDAVAPAVQELTDSFGACTVDAQNALQDQDLILEGQVAWIKVFGNATQQVSITRDALLNWSERLPWFWGTVVDGCLFSPRIAFNILMRTVNLDKLNARLALAGRTSTSAFCDTVYALSGAVKPAATVEPEPPDALEVTEFFVSGDFSNGTFTKTAANKWELSYDSIGDGFPEGTASIELSADAPIAGNVTARLTGRAFYNDWTGSCGVDYNTNGTLLQMRWNAVNHNPDATTPNGNEIEFVWNLGTGETPVRVLFPVARACQNTGVVTNTFTLEFIYP